MAAKVNETITGNYDHRGDSVIYGDTDSVYFSAFKSLQKEIQSGTIPWERENVIALYDKIAQEVNGSFTGFMTRSFHCPKTRGDVIAAGRELIASKGLFITKKRYAVLYYDKEGKRTDVDGKEGKMKAFAKLIKCISSLYEGLSIKVILLFAIDFFSFLFITFLRHHILR